MIRCLVEAGLNRKRPGQEPPEVMVRKLISILITAVVILSVPVAIAADYDQVDCCIRECS